jgi:hypothetical protein
LFTQLVEGQSFSQTAVPSVGADLTYADITAVGVTGLANVVTNVRAIAPGTDPGLSEPDFQFALRGDLIIGDLSLSTMSEGKSWALATGSGQTYFIEYD